MSVLAWRRIKQSRLYALTREIKWRVEEFASSDQRQRYRVVSLSPEQPRRGNALLSRINRAFLRRPGEPIPTTHQNVWEAYQMAQIFLGLGFAVDVIDFENDSFLPTKDYSIFVDARLNMERIAPLLNKDCVKVLHAVTAHPLFQNAAELRRLLALQQRRGITLRPRRQDPLNRGIVHADYATILGNQFTTETYRFAHKPLYPIACATPFVYPSPATKDYPRCRNRFLFMAGTGMVHKGLDRVLEAFTSMPNCSLMVCGSVEKEEDFVRAYRRELYETENIHLVGWVDVSSRTFLDLANSCVALLHPSCSEGSATSVVTCMHAGLIPVASVESGVDISPEFGIVLKDSSIDEIREAVGSIARLPASTLQQMGQGAWRQAREIHSLEHFATAYKGILSTILGRGQTNNSPSLEGVLTQ